MQPLAFCISPKMSTMDFCTALCLKSKGTCPWASCRRSPSKKNPVRIFATGIKIHPDRLQ